MRSEENKQFERFKKIRGSWNGVNPVTKVIPDKRRKAPKHRKRDYDV